MDQGTMIYRLRRTGAASMAFALTMAAVLAVLAACTSPRPDAGQPCPVAGCPVPVDAQPLYVPLCGAGEMGPCVGTMAGAWYYMDLGQAFPRGRRIAPCATEDGGTGPCVWVPSAMGNNQGDSGAYVYGVVGHGFPLPGEVEPS